MVEVELFLSLLDKEALIGICNEFSIKIDGFQRKLKDAPQNKLGGGLKTALYDGMINRKRRGGTNPVKFEDVLQYVIEQTKKQYPDIGEVSLEELFLRVQLDSEFAYYKAYSLLYVRFPDKFKDCLEKMEQNWKNKQPLFEGITNVDELNTTEKFTYLINACKSEDEKYQSLTTFEQIIMNGPDRDIFVEMKEKIRGISDEDLLAMLVASPKNIQGYIILSFLLHDENYKKAENILHLKYVTTFFYEEIADQALATNHKLEKKIEKQEKVMEELQNQLEKLLEEKKIADEKEKKNESLKISFEILKKEKQKIEVENKKSEPFIYFFEQLIKEDDMVLFTSELDSFTDTPFERIVCPIEKLLEAKKRKDLSFLKGKSLFITRVSFKKTMEWASLLNFLNKNSMTFIELSGYETDDYIKQFIEYVYRKENEVYDYKC